MVKEIMELGGRGMLVVMMMVTPATVMEVG